MGRKGKQVWGGGDYSVREEEGEEVGERRGRGRGGGRERGRYE